jgi:hypothetical protein
VPEELNWQNLLARDGDDLEVHYRHVLTELGRRSGMLGIVFRKAQNRIIFASLTNQYQVSGTKLPAATTGNNQVQAFSLLPGLDSNQQPSG